MDIGPELGKKWKDCELRGGGEQWREEVPSTYEHYPQRKLNVLFKPCGLMCHP